MLGVSQNVELGDAGARMQSRDCNADREIDARRQSGPTRSPALVSEKVLAAAKAGSSLMAGASADKIVEQYRKKVAANAKRLSRKRTRRRRK